MGKYRRYSLEEREELSRGLSRGESLRQIAHRLGRHTSTLSREIGRNAFKPDLYRAVLANNEAQARRTTRKRKLDQYPRLREYVFAKLALRWSPEQIAQMLRREFPQDGAMQISHESIYDYLYVLPRGELKKTLINYLRQERKMRRKRTGLKEQRGKIPEMISIEERPAEVADRSVPGHWEGDLILGKGHKSALGTLVERKTRWLFLVPLKNKDAESVRKSFAKTIRRLPRRLRKTMTYDQGKEMSEHQLFTKGTKVKVFFAHPGSPWERGTCENTNGLIRQFFPKGTDFNKVPPKEIRWVEGLLNGRPRKTLGFQTPKEVIGALLR
jgi:transposase, IS30 family